MSLSFMQSEKNCKALPTKHFPSTFQSVLWRNWGMVPVERLARVLRCNAEELCSAAAQLGLNANDDSNCAIWHERGYQTIIRQNWHLLPIEQLLELLDWTPVRLAYVLKEDDFLWTKLGQCKPNATPVKFCQLTPNEIARTAEIRKSYLTYRKMLLPATAAPFDFLKRTAPKMVKATPPGTHLRMIYSYSALYGDPLLEGTEKIYPDNLLDEYAAAGINALWIQAVLYTLTPWFGETTLSENWQTRQVNLRRLAQRMAQRGIRLFLYLNEPRAMPEWVFDNCCLDWRGASQHMGLYSFCTSHQEVLAALSNAMETLFRTIPELGGFLTVTMSENPTNCWSHTLFAPPTNCLRCLPRGQATVISELITAMATGAWRAAPDAEVIAWNWGWEQSWDEQVVAKLPVKVKLMCVSETGLLTESAGIKGSVWDYSISKVGPGPWARRLWSKARSRGMSIMAKVQLNNSWECSAVPYLPTPGLIERHLQNLRELGINDFMLSWTLGGYAGGNTRLLSHSKKELTENDFGPGASLVIKAYDCFDRGFACFPFNMVSQIYLAPQNYGPVNQLYQAPTGNKATMLGFPYDDLHSWTGEGHYPEDVLEEQYRKISKLWADGLSQLDAAHKLIPAHLMDNYKDLRSVADAVYCHFRSSYLQIAFIRRRDQGLDAVKLLLEEEIELAIKLLNVIRCDSRIGFEASNHYYYTENSLMEKVFNCQYLLHNMKHKIKNFKQEIESINFVAS
jgi:hypothetical protein